MPTIDPTARVAPEARIADDAEIGPFCTVGRDVEIGAGVRLMSHVVVAGVTAIGAATVVHPFASLGGPPQSGRYRGGPTRLIIGARCQIREGVTVNTGTEDDRALTSVGDDCFLMANSHVAHDCDIGNHVVFANNAVIGGHCQVGDYVFLGGQCAVHQFVRIGECAMIAGFSAVREDVIPYGYVLYPVARLAGLNVVGMKRRGFTRSNLHALRAAYQALFEHEGNFADRVEAVAAEHGASPGVDKIVAFLRAAKRPVMMPTVRGGQSTETFE